MQGPYDEVDGFSDPEAPPIPQPRDGSNVAELPLRQNDPYTDEQVVEDFGDLDEFVAPEPKRLPYRGEIYDFPADVDARAWLLLQKIRREGIRAGLAQKRNDTSYNPDEIVLDDDEENHVREQVMGETEQDLAEDNVPGRVIERMFATLMIWHLGSKESAQRMWRGEVRLGEAAARTAPNRQERRRQQRASRQAGR